MPSQSDILQETKPKIWPFVFGIILFILSVTPAFIGGYYLKTLSIPIPIVSVPPTPIMQTPQPDEKLLDSTLIVPGKEYYDDTILAISTDTPKKILVATVTRHETNGGVNQNTRVSFFNGDSWARTLLNKINPTAAIYTNSLISDWQIHIDPSRVLKQSVDGKLTINQDAINFETGVLTNNIGVRSLPGYTKFISNGDGKILLNNNLVPAKILYTRIYSNNSKELQFYDSPLGLTTHWLAFWDANGNFYHLDSTDVKNPTEIYRTHQFGAMVDKFGKVSKTFDVEVVTNAENPPNSYQIHLGYPINVNLTFSIGKSINKAPNNSYNWFMSEGTGKANGVDGYGVIEYIHN